MKIQLSFVTFLILGSITVLQSMEMQIRQPAPLKFLAAQVVAANIDPNHSIPNALKIFENPNLISSAVGPAIASILARSREQTLYTILKSQVPLSVEIKRFEQYPENVYSSPHNGLCVRTRKNTYDPDQQNRLYPGMADFIPDPANEHAPTQFLQIYSNPNSRLFFDDDDKYSQDRDIINNGICIWDKQSGARINDGSSIKKQLRDRFPQFAENDPNSPDLLLYGISSDDQIAWMRLWPRLKGEGLCAFRIDDNTIISANDGALLDQMSYSGGCCVIHDLSNSNILLVSSDDPFKKLVLGSQSIRMGTMQLDVIEIAPQDNYLLCEYREANQNQIRPALIYNFATNTWHPITIEGQQIGLNLYYQKRLHALSSDGKFLVAVQEKTAYVVNPLTNQTIAKILLPDINQHSSKYHLLFSPDNSKLLVLVNQSCYDQHAYDHSEYNLQIFDIATQKCIQEFTKQEIAQDDDPKDFILCNNGDYLLLPNGQLFIQPQGLANKLSLQQLLALLLLEQLKVKDSPIGKKIVDCLLANPLPKIRELITRRYASHFKRTPEATEKDK